MERSDPYLRFLHRRNGAVILERWAELEQEVERLRRENEGLRRELKKALRAAKRQAAPFARHAPKETPPRPGW